MNDAIVTIEEKQDRLTRCKACSKSFEAPGRVWRCAYRKVESQVYTGGGYRTRRSYWPCMDIERCPKQEEGAR